MKLVSHGSHGGTARHVATWIAVISACAIWWSGHALAQTDAQFERGITGSVTFRYAGPPLRAKVQREAESPLVVRLQPGQAPGQYEARFIGNVSGPFDLRDWLEHADGSSAQAMPSIPIEIVSTLPQDQRSDLFEANQFQPSLTGGYRIALALKVIAWLAVPAIILLRRFMSRPPVEQALPAPAPVPLAQQLEPLIAAAAEGQLTIADKARLELLLLHYWREVEHLPQLDMASSIGQLRKHPQAGPMIAAIEGWLHGGEVMAGTESLGRVLELLKPIRQAAQTASATSQDQPVLAGSDGP